MRSILKLRRNLPSSWLGHHNIYRAASTWHNDSTWNKLNKLAPRVAVEGCGHGTLDGIYSSVAKEVAGSDGGDIDLLIICGDFQATRNAADLTLMSVPPKYRKLADFPAYYSGQKKAPYLTLFIGGNHEAPSHLAELHYGGWVAPNMYYLGPANVLRFGPLRIAGLSGIWKEHDYHLPHHERLPFSRRDVKTFYSQREIDVRKLLLLREPVDVGLSHDWPQDIVRHGDLPALLKEKPWFGKESKDGRLGSPAAKYVMDRLRPAHWFSAHLHCRFPAIKVYEGLEEPLFDGPKQDDIPQQGQGETSAEPDDIDSDESEMESTEDYDDAKSEEPEEAHATEQEQEQSEDDAEAQSLPPPPSPSKLDQDGKPRRAPGQPVPPTISNKKTRFVALDKCLPVRKCIEVLTVVPLDTEKLSSSLNHRQPYAPKKAPRFQLTYDPEWLAIQRAFAPLLGVIGSGDPESPKAPPDLGEAAYLEMVDRERAWVDEHVVQAGKLAVPANFARTAPPHRPAKDPAIVDFQPEEYTNPQTTAFCQLLGVEDHWDASAEERAERKARGPLGPPPITKGDLGGGGGGGKGGRGGSKGGSKIDSQRWRGTGSNKHRPRASEKGGSKSKGGKAKTGK